MGADSDLKNETESTRLKPVCESFKGDADTVYCTRCDWDRSTHARAANDYAVRACEKFEGERGELACNRCLWPRGMHPPEIKPATDYVLAANEIGRLVTEKQAAYGDSFGKAGRILRELYPEGIKPEQLDDALTIVRVVDKLFRIATKKDAFGESPWKDIMGYALLSVVRDGKK